MSIPLLDSWITKATVARDALAKAEERIRELEADYRGCADALEEARMDRDREKTRVVQAGARAEKAEARVAELEAMRVAVAEEVGWGIVDSVEAREREEC